VLQKVLWLSLAGAFGTVSRFALCEAAAKLDVAPVPLGTFAVNIIGSFLFGLIYASADRKLNMTPETRVIILTGFMGAFTTFSAFAFETAKMMRASQWVFAAGNIMGQVTLGIMALGIGVLVGRSL
jgi:fluoride exporter